MPVGYTSSGKKVVLYTSLEEDSHVKVTPTTYARFTAPRYVSILADNGLFKLIKKGVEFSLQPNYLRRYIFELWVRFIEPKRAQEVLFVVPDYPNDIDTHLAWWAEWAPLVRDWGLVPVFVLHQLPKILERLPRDVEVVAIPSRKLTTSIGSVACKNARHAHFEVLRQAAAELARLGLRIHFLGPCRELLHRLFKWDFLETIQYDTDSYKIDTTARARRENRVFSKKSEEKDRLKAYLKSLGVKLLGEN